MPPPITKYSFDYKKLNVDDVLIHSKLYTEDDSEEYNRVHSENNRTVLSTFLLAEVDQNLMLPKFSCDHLSVLDADLGNNL